MGRSYYDVVVFGSETGPLAAGALLAHRGFRVLAVGDKKPFSEYNCYGYNFSDRPFTMTAAASPVISRIMGELSLTQMYNRIRISENLPFQVILPDARISFFNDPIKTRTEIEREFPKLKGMVDPKLREIARLSTEIEKMLNSDMVIPPESFFEKRAFSRSIIQNPFFNRPKTDIFELLDVSEKLKQILLAPVICHSGRTTTDSPISLSRQLGSWLFDNDNLSLGIKSLNSLLTDKIIAEGGDVQDNFTIEHIVVNRNKVTGVKIKSREEIISTSAVLTGKSPSELAQFISVEDRNSKFKTLCEKSIQNSMGYSINLGINSEVIPKAMAQTVFIKPSRQLANIQWLRIEQIPQKLENKIALNISCTLKAEEKHLIFNGSLRDNILDTTRELIPFLDNYLEVIHSPFDNENAIVLNNELLKEESSFLQLQKLKHDNWPIYHPKKDSYLGIENNFHRTGIKGLILSGEQVLSGIPLEGAFIAAWGAAKIISKDDPAPQRITRSIKNRLN
ncbi:MAG: hypothetical protein JXR91_03495 [Deltaproteobacteria bacterium]|nr:hypothetical protein [Deltaproteobacteria bacterium]